MEQIFLFLFYTIHTKIIKKKTNRSKPKHLFFWSTCFHVILYRGSGYLGKGEGTDCKWKISHRKCYSLWPEESSKELNYNTAITYKSSPSFLYILYSVHTFFFHTFYWFFLIVLFFFKRAERRVGLKTKYSGLFLSERVNKPLLVSSWQQLLLLICAGQRVATVVSSHV